MQKDSIHLQNNNVSKTFAEDVKRQEKAFTEYIEYFKAVAAGKLSPDQIERIIQEANDIKTDDESDESDNEL